MGEKEGVNKNELKRRLRHVLLNVIEIISVGVVYYIFIRLFKVALPCPIYALFGKYCPGCGISRMCVSLFHLDFQAAYLSNRFLFILSPFLLIYFIWKSIEYIRFGYTKTGKIETAVIFVIAIGAIAFMILRNMEQFAFLQPVGMIS